MKGPAFAPSDQLAQHNCWTCKDRRVRCDRALPHCSNCARLKRTCQGYGVRLSWPRPGDRKRELRNPHLRSSHHKGYTTGHLTMINTTSRDIALHTWLVEQKSDTIGINRQPRFLPSHLLDTSRHPGLARSLDGQICDAFEFFSLKAFKGLIVLDQDVASLKQSLIHLALLNDDVASNAVLLAVLAFATHHREGPQLRSYRLQSYAVSALARSASRGTLTKVEAAQHTAAGMLLYLIEIHCRSDATGHWLQYILGVKNMIAATGMDHAHQDETYMRLLDWVYYHNVIAQFSVIQLHLNQTDPGRLSKLRVPRKGLQEVDMGAQLSDPINPSHRALTRLSRLHDVLLEEEILGVSEGGYTPAENGQGWIDPVTSVLDLEDLLAIDSTQDNDTIKLFNMTSAIYLQRVADSRSSVVEDLSALVTSSFALLARMGICGIQFPLMILAHEAVMDEQRVLIMDVIRNTEATIIGREIVCIRHVLHDLWVQLDLAMSLDIVPKYMEIWSTLMIKSGKVPCLA